MTALDEALCWSCGICTFSNPLETGQCAMCNNPRPQIQYENLLAIREEARRQRMLQEEQDRQIAMHSNANSIKYQSVISDANRNNNNNEEREQETAKKLLEMNDDEDWNEEDFKDDDDDDEDWGDNEESNHNMDNNGGDGDEEYEDEEYDDGDDGWGDAELTEQTADIEMKIPQKKQVYEVLNPYKLRDYQVQFMRDIGEELYISDMEDIGILCRYYRWNRDDIMNSYLADSNRVLLECGIKSSAMSQTAVQKSGSFDCFLCITQYSDCASSTFHPLQCGHQYCVECWRKYLIAQMEKGPRCVFTKCIDTRCKLTLRPTIFLKFLPYKYRMKYEEYILHSFVSGVHTVKWCPGNECVNAVRVSSLYRTSYESNSIECPSCNHLWCFECIRGAHLPCNCQLADKWIQLHSTDSENITWVRAYTKECPKCNNHIEKNQGCNHMTCRCGYEFCWLCRRDWKKIGYGHQCNKPQDVIDEENEQKSAQSYLKRYMFYFARYEAHENSAAIATKSIASAKECIRSFIINKEYKYSDLQFIEDAIKEIIHCRHILQWSYCYGYYLADHCPLKVLFETQQGLLESFSDQLHEKAEKKIDDKAQWYTLCDIKFRTELINLTKTAKKYRNNFCDALLSQSDDDVNTSSLKFVFQKGLK